MAHARTLQLSSTDRLVTRGPLAHFRAAAGACLLAVLVLGCGADRPSSFSADSASIHGRLTAAAAHLKARNLEAWAALYSEDAVLQPAAEPEVRGRAALLAWSGALPELAVVEFTNVSITVSGDMAYATSSYVTQPKGFPPHSGKQLVVLRRDARGEWLVTAASMSADAALPGPPTGSAPR